MRQFNVLSITTTHYVVAPIFAACFFVGAYFYTRDVRRSLREGATAFSGNRPNTRSNRWQRTQNPLMFWYGIGMKIFLILLCASIGVIAVLYVILGRVPLPGFHAET